MKRRLLIIILILSFLVISGCEEYLGQKEPELSPKNNNYKSIEQKQLDIDLEPNEYSPTSLIVKFKESSNIRSKAGVSNFITNLSGRNQIISGSHFEDSKQIVKSLKYEDTYGLKRIFLLEFEDADVLKLVSEFEKQEEVEYAEPNFIYKTMAVPNDEYYNLQWSHQNMKSEQAWNIETGSEDVVIAIIDTGVDYNHLDLSDNIWVNEEEIPDNGLDDDENGYIDDYYGFDFINSHDINGDGDYNDPEDINDPNPYDDNGHGTHCAGIATAVTNNNLGIAGTCWNCKIMPIKFLNHKGVGSIDDAVPSIIYAVDNGADILSNSWGGGTSEAAEDAINYANSQGSLFIASAGNSNRPEKLYPAGYENAFSVASTAIDDTKSSFSSYGSWVDVAAPGGEVIYGCYDCNESCCRYPLEISVLSTLSSANLWDCWDQQCGVMSNGAVYMGLAGTSMAAPTVAGLAGLIKSKHPEFTKEEIITIIHSAVDPFSSDFYAGTGRINLLKALQYDKIPLARLDSSLDGIILTKDDEILNITGFASGESFENYKIEYGIGPYPDEWDLLLKSNISVTNNTLTILNLTSLEEIGFYTIKLTVTDIFGNVAIDMINIFFDNERRIFNTEDSLYFSSPSLGDIDNDGNLEVVIGDYGGYVYVFNSDGTLSRGWPQLIDGIAYYSPALGDIDNDGKLEIVVGTMLGNLIYAFNDDGTLVNGWPQNTFGYIYSSTTLGDIDNDGKLEIIVGDSAEYLYVFNSDGTLLEGWPQETDGDIDSSPALGDIDNDGKLEIVVSNDDGNLYVFNSDGTLLEGWPQETGDDIKSSPALGDIDNDGKLEIVIGCRNSNLYAFNNDGTLLEGWPRFIGGRVDSSPALGDIDNDGKLEIVVGTRGNYLSVLDLDTQYNPANIEWPMFQHDAQHTGLYSSLIICQNSTQTNCGEVFSPDCNSLGQTVCCGDDSEENFKYRDCADSYSPYFADSCYDQEEDDACCDDVKDCVMEGICHTRNRAEDFRDDMWTWTNDAGTTGHYKCLNVPGMIYDCDQDPDVCQNLDWACNVDETRPYGRAAGWAFEGENETFGGYGDSWGRGIGSWGVYDQGPSSVIDKEFEECCGDDEGEFLITGNGFTRCCNHPNDFIDVNGNCVTIGKKQPISAIEQPLRSPITLLGKLISFLENLF